MSHDLRIHAAELCGCGAVLLIAHEKQRGQCLGCQVRACYITRPGPVGRRTGLTLAQLREGRES